MTQSLKYIAAFSIIFVVVMVFSILNRDIQRPGDSKRFTDNRNVSKNNRKSQASLPINKNKESSGISALGQADKKQHIGLKNIEIDISDKKLASMLNDTNRSKIINGMQLNIDKIQNSPENVRLKRKPKIGQKIVYKQTVITCDKNGQPIDSGVGFESTITAEVVECNIEKDIYVIAWNSSPLLMIRGSKDSSLYDDPRGKSWKEIRSLASDCILSSTGQLGSGPFAFGDNSKDFPVLQIPEEPLLAEKKWTYTSINNKNNQTAIVMKGYVVVNGWPCIIFEEDTRVKTIVELKSGKDSGKSTSVPLNIGTKGKIYIDYNTGFVIAEDKYIETGGMPEEGGYGQILHIVKQVTSITP